MTRQTLREFVIFCIVGFSGLLLNLGVTYILKEFVGWHYFPAYLVATIIGFTFIFLANSSCNFSGHEKSNYLVRYGKFMSGYAVLFIVNISLVSILTSALSVYYIFSIIIASAITTILTFTFSKKMIFTHRR